MRRRTKMLIILLQWAPYIKIQWKAPKPAQIVLILQGRLKMMKQAAGRIEAYNVDMQTFFLLDCTWRNRLGSTTRCLCFLILTLDFSTYASIELFPTVDRKCWWSATTYEWCEMSQCGCNSSYPCIYTCWWLFQNSSCTTGDLHQPISYASNSTQGTTTTWSDASDTSGASDKKMMQIEQQSIKA